MLIIVWHGLIWNKMQDFAEMPFFLSPLAHYQFSSQNGTAFTKSG